MIYCGQVYCLQMGRDKSDTWWKWTPPTPRAVSERQRIRNREIGKLGSTFAPNMKIKSFLT